jgi:hypothetical protein
MENPIGSEKKIKKIFEDETKKKELKTEGGPGEFEGTF